MHVMYYLDFKKPHSNVFITMFLNEGLTISVTLFNSGFFKCLFEMPLIAS